jgi:hypothetical protein
MCSVLSSFVCLFVCFPLAIVLYDPFDFISFYLPLGIFKRFLIECLFYNVSFICTCNSFHQSFKWASPLLILIADLYLFNLMVNSRKQPNKYLNTSLLKFEINWWQEAELNKLQCKYISLRDCFINAQSLSGLQ